MTPEEQPITAQEQPITPEEQLAELVRLGAGQAVIDGFRRANGLPLPEPAPMVIRVRAVVLAPRPRRRQPKRVTKPAPTKDPVAQARGRFDLLEFEDTDNA